MKKISSIFLAILTLSTFIYYLLRYSCAGFSGKITIENSIKKCIMHYGYVNLENVTILENEVVDYNGIMFMGATLWTDLNRRDLLTEYHIKQCMNDYHKIRMKGDAYDLYHKLKPYFTVQEHTRSLEYFKIVLEQNRNRDFVIITHHAPSFQSVHEYYKNDTLINGGYMSRLDEFIMDHPNIRLWTHGHMHNTSDYLIDNTRVVCNPRGYLPYEDDNGFDPGFTVEL